MKFFHDLEDYLTEEFHFGDTAKNFIAQWAPSFERYIDSGSTLDDIPLPLYGAFLRYQELLEGKLELFLERRDVNAREFYAWCREALEGDSEADGGNREFIQILCASETFERFFELMSETIRMQASLLRLEHENARLRSIQHDVEFQGTAAHANSSSEKK